MRWRYKMLNSKAEFTKEALSDIQDRSTESILTMSSLCKMASCIRSFSKTLSRSLSLSLSLFLSLSSCFPLYRVVRRLLQVASMRHGKTTTVPAEVSLLLYGTCIPTFQRKLLPLHSSTRKHEVRSLETVMCSIFSTA